VKDAVHGIILQIFPVLDLIDKPIFIELIAGLPDLFLPAHTEIRTILIPCRIHQHFLHMSVRMAGIAHTDLQPQHTVHVSGSCHREILRRTVLHIHQVKHRLLPARVIRCALCPLQ
jgi:hypothetical protein